MKRYFIILNKIIIAIICCVAISGFISYEIISINKTEYAHQTKIANEAHEQIALNLNMIKIAIQTENLNQYEENLSKLYENSTKIEPLFLLKDEQKDYLASLYSYMNVLESHKRLLSGIIKLKQNVLEIEKVFKENYNKDTVSREKLTDLSNEIEKIKINPENYPEESLLDNISLVNEILDNIITEAKKLTECIDKCYKNRIDEINEELAGKFKDFASKTDDLNKAFEKQFEFETLDKLKQF